MLDDIGTYRKLGLNHLVICAESNDLQQTLDRIESFAAEIMARLG